jgi:hypothetical protein
MEHLLLKPQGLGVVHDQQHTSLRDAADCTNSARLATIADPFANTVWTTARVLGLLPSGSTVGFDADPPQGRIGPGLVLEHWRSPDNRAQGHPVTLWIRRDLVMALGGGMALPASADTGLLLAANAISPGCLISEVGLLYRKWPGQMTSRPYRRSRMASTHGLCRSPSQQASRTMATATRWNFSHLTRSRKRSPDLGSQASNQC